jgi:signal transduction histidine kinase
MDFEKRTGIECRAGIQDNLNLAGLSAEMQLLCYRIVQEALTNIERHAKAREAVLSIRNSRRVFPGEGGQRESLLICVSDDGGGSAQKYFTSPGTASLGIRSMYERTRILGGALEFLNEPGQGLTVRLEAPLGRLEDTPNSADTEKP